jgi:Abortive infection alpha
VDDLLGIGKATEAVSKELAQLISPLLHPGAEIGGQIIADQMNHWRCKRAVILLEKTMDFLKRKDIDPRSVPPKILAVVLNQGSLEEDETLSSKWAGLLASAAAGDAVHPSYPGILEQLTPGEARMLDIMYQCHIENPSDEYKASFQAHELYRVIKLPGEQFNIALHNLKSLELYQTTSVIEIPHRSIESYMLEITLTFLGENFVKVCRGPQSIHEKTQKEN